MKNVGILGKSPETTIKEIEKCDFLKKFSKTDPHAAIICKLTNRMCPNRFLRFIRENHIGVLFVPRDFNLDCSAEDFEPDEFMHVIEHVCTVIWQEN
jgi:hypothetical protein